MAAHGYDASLPRNGTIFFYSVLAVFILILTDFLLESYFAKMIDAEVHDKVLTRGMDQVKEMRAHEQEMLGKTHMDDAMKLLAQRGRLANPQIAPKSGQGMAEVAGWTQLNRKIAPMPAAA